VNRTPEGAPGAESSDLDEGEALGRRATINDVARLAKVSKKTVSRVINNSPSVKEDTRRRVEAVIERFGYAPDPQARGLAFRRSFLIGLIYDNPNPQYVIDMQQGILHGVGDSGYELVVHPCNRHAPGFLSNLRNFVERQKLFGVVLPPSVSEDERVAELLRTIGCPFVRIASIPLDEPASMLVTHDHKGGAEAARHLAALGHQRVAFVSGPSSFRSSHERGRGFAAGLQARGLTLEDRYVREGAYTFESGVACGADLLAMAEPPTAVFTGNDEMAAGVYQAVRARGLEIPRDLSVVGFDDSPLASRVWPPLTTVRLPIRDMGRIAAEKLLERAKDRSERRLDGVEVIPRLVERQSAGAPKS
jgi:LacI family transcriptional regulator